MLDDRGSNRVEILSFPASNCSCFCHVIWMTTMEIENTRLIVRALPFLGFSHKLYRVNICDTPSFKP